MNENDLSFSDNSSPKSWFERNKFPYPLVVFGWIILAFILFQTVGALFSVIFVVMRVGTDQLMELPVLIQENLDLLIAGNSVGQILVLGTGSWVLTKIAFPGKKVADVIRFKASPQMPLNLGMALALIIAFQPIVMLLSWVNLQIPFPESYLNFERQQIKLLEDFLLSDHIMLITLIHIAVVPAFCEEIMYRGFALRLLNKAWPIAKVIMVTGIVFGLYHLRLTQLLPLSALGILLAWITWRTDSIVPAILAHFINNGASVLLSRIYPEMISSQSLAEELPSWWLILLGLVGSAVLIRIITQQNPNPKTAS